MAAMTSCGNTIIGPVYIYIFLNSLGSFSNNDGDGYENVTFKSEFALLQILSRLFDSNSSNSSNVGKFFWYKRLYSSSGKGKR